MGTSCTEIIATGERFRRQSQAFHGWAIIFPLLRWQYGCY
ncbi:Uncharacterised protein [Vibrio cholerae]|nr:Uncharacterised protein [Vibrio cholerae]CSI85434.1 Uncharacterised protein [Vibrio cholerae]